MRRVPEVEQSVDRDRVEVCRHVVGVEGLDSFFDGVPLADG
jgi:hypothetical protein